MAKGSPGQLSNHWIADTGATMHMTGSLVGMRSVKKLESSDIVQIANGEELKIESIGEYHGFYLDENGEKQRIMLRDVGYTPDLDANLFSVTKALSLGMKLGNVGKSCCWRRMV